jgi:hypothetical protein
MVRMTIIAAAMVMVSSTVFAQDAQRSGTSQQQQACSKDVSRHCRSVMKESDAIIANCLRQNQAKLSKSCIKAMGE